MPKCKDGKAPKSEKMHHTSVSLKTLQRIHWSSGPWDDDRSLGPGFAWETVDGYGQNLCLWSKIFGEPLWTPVMVWEGGLLGANKNVAAWGLACIPKVILPSNNSLLSFNMWLPLFIFHRV